MGSLEQERAEYAWRFIAGTDSKKAFQEAVVGAPAMVMSNGLMQTMAFYQSKERDYGDVLRAMLEPLSRLLSCSAEFGPVMKALQGSTPERYMQATEEALETLKWLRHFAKALAKE